jgi:hypothetical protein
MLSASKKAWKNLCGRTSFNGQGNRRFGQLQGLQKPPNHPMRSLQIKKPRLRSQADAPLNRAAGR